MDLSLISYDELEEELERRNKIKAGPWPKRICLDVELMLIDKDKLDDFLITSCALEIDEAEAVVAVDIFTKIVLEVDQDGNGKIIEFNDRKLVDKVEQE